MGSNLNYSKAATNSTMMLAEVGSENALPASWYSSQEVYEFERRAIFSKRWLLMSHKSRLSNTGDWLRYTFANHDIIITRDRTGAINSFHNVCRHRAYPVVEKEGSGNNKILACRYHGWSYGLNGKLAKATGYQEMTIDKDTNSLFRCHINIDSNGFIWINLDAKVVPEIEFVEYPEEVDTKEYTFDKVLKREDLESNWKTLTADSIPEKLKTDFNPKSTAFFPNASIINSSKYIAIQKILPQSPEKSTKHIELYRHQSCSDEEWTSISGAYTEAVKADQDTDTTRFSLQAAVRDAVKEHYEQEKVAGREIWPSSPTIAGASEQVDEDERFCAGLACGPRKEVLAW